MKNTLWQTNNGKSVKETRVAATLYFPVLGCSLAAAFSGWSKVVLQIEVDVGINRIL